MKPLEKIRSIALDVLIRLRPWRARVVLFICAGIITGISLYQLFQDLSPGRSYISVGLLDYGEHKFAKAHIVVEKRSGLDVLKIDLNLRGSQKEAKGAVFGISLPSRFSRIIDESSTRGAKYSHTRKSDGNYSRQYWFFETTNDGSGGVVSLLELFAGEVVSGRGPEHTAIFSFDYLSTPFPVSLSLRNVRSSAVEYASPTPTEQYEFSLEYNENAVANAEHEEIVLRFNDKDAQLLHSRNLLLYGILFGICGSVFATFFVEWVSRHDKKKAQQ